MSVGDSNKSKYGGVAELAGRLSNFSGEVAATAARFFRKGSLGLMGGIGNLDLEAVLFMVLDDKEEQVMEEVKLRRFGSVEVVVVVVEAAQSGGGRRRMAAMSGFGVVG